MAIGNLERMVTVHLSCPSRLCSVSHQVVPRKQNGNASVLLVTDDSTYKNDDLSCSGSVPLTIG